MPEAPDATDLSAVTFIDVEADRSGRVLAIGAVRGDETLRVDPRAEGKGAATALARLAGEGWLAGHNLLEFDLPHLAREPVGFTAGRRRRLDTLVLSMLAEPDRPSHALERDREEAGRIPDPVAHARRARERAAAAVERLASIDPAAAGLYASLLEAAGHDGAARVVLAAAGLDSGREGGGGLPPPREAWRRLPEQTLSRLCRVQLGRMIEEGLEEDGAAPLTLALALRFVETHAREGRLSGAPSAALATRPRFMELLTGLLGPLCPDRGCPHRDRCDVHRPFAVEILQRNFDLNAFRPHQEEIIEALLAGRSPLAVMPTGGGKSLCYQLPAVHGGERLRGLTVVVSPLQALMADQVRSLSERYPPSCYVNANLLMEARRQNLEGLRSGRYHVLYLGPEQLRNPSMIRLLKNRPPFLWIIDEAHCISQWGHSFRTDYTYLPRAIARIHEHSRRPLIGLFTATASRQVKQDIVRLVGEGLGARVQEMDFSAPRENLRHEVVRIEDRGDKRAALLNLLAAHPEGTRLVYCATVRTAGDVAGMLREEGIACALYHGRLEPNEKAEQLERFLSGRARTVVATSAFGMGIDKPDIRLVVHYEISGSLEEYVQETGRAGRDGEPSRCVLLFCEEDLETQFFLKTASRVTGRDVRYVFKALRAKARRLRRAAGEDGRVPLWVQAEDLFVEENLEEQLEWTRDALQVKLKLVLYHLEADGVLERLENRTRALGVYPLESSLEKAAAKLPEQASPATRRVLEYLYDRQRPRQVSVLDIADEAALRPAEAFREVLALGRRGLIGQDLSFEVTLARGVPRSSGELAERWFAATAELFALGEGLDEAPVVNLRLAAAEIGRALAAPFAPHELFHLLRGLRRQGLLRMEKAGRGRYRVRFEPNFLQVREELDQARRVARAVLRYADRHLKGRQGRDVAFTLDVPRFVADERRLIESFTPEAVVSACLLLHHLDVWHLADPPVLLETAMRLRVDPDAKVSDLDLRRPRRYHEHQIALVHMMREYAVLDPHRRWAYARDYFRLDWDELLARYFKGRRRALAAPVGPNTEREILDGLSAAQRAATTAREAALLVVAGPGSGKTVTVVRRITHLVRARQVRPEEILVLAFNRAAASELRHRLSRSLGRRAQYVDVRTFHSLALRLTGIDLQEKRGDRGDLEGALDRAMAHAADLLEAAEAGESSAEREAAEQVRRQALHGVGHVLVDEYQDLDPDQYRLLAALVGLDRGGREAERTERSIYVVGDDDQAIYGFRRASVEFLRRFEDEFEARRICLAENFRSVGKITEAAATFIQRVPGRLKTGGDEQMIPAPGVGDGGERAVRRFVYRDSAELAGHARFIIEQSLDGGIGSIAVLARHWSQLDRLRYLLEQQSIPFVLHRPELHRPIHRRHPVARVIKRLWKKAEKVEGSVEAWLRALIESWGRSPAEPPVAELLALAVGLDRERPVRAGGGAAPISTHEIADAILLASREAARDSEVAGGETPAVHLSTFHGAKGLEFDKVVVFPRHPGPRDDAEEEARLFYVAMTRARSELVLASFGQAGELAAGVDAPEHDLRRAAARMRAPFAAYLDATPRHVQLAGRALYHAQGLISGLREGDPLEVVSGGRRLTLSRDGETVAALSDAGQKRFDALAKGHRAYPRARVHEVFVQLDRDRDGRIRKDHLVVLPTLLLTEGAPRPSGT